MHHLIRDAVMSIIYKDTHTQTDRTGTKLVIILFFKIKTIKFFFNFPKLLLNNEKQEKKREHVFLCFLGPETKTKCKNV
jgi:hypothetical protein